MTTVPMKCPSCGGTVFATARKPESYDDFIGAICARCRARLTDGDVKRAAITIVEEKHIKEGLKTTR